MDILRAACGIMLLLTVALNAAADSAPAFTMSLTLADGGQRATLAFDGLALMTGNLEAQSFFPPGKVADYTGFQYLRDNDPDNMGHNTSFLTRVANNVIYILSDSQLAQLETLATNQLSQINLYGYKRFALMKAFRRLIESDLPAGSTGLKLSNVKQVSRELYLIDGQISFDRALLYANILNSLTAEQKAYLDAMKGKGWNSWPDIPNNQISSKMRGLAPGTSVAVMTYAGDLYSWYAGSLTADVYFCPERHGTYYGGFYIKDAPAVGHEGYSISEQLTATAGAALCDSSKGYVTSSQAAAISSLVNTQRNNLYAGPTNIVQIRTQIATLLRSLLTSTASSASVNAQVLALSGSYGDLDGENNYNYATVFSQVYNTLTADQKIRLAALRQSIMSGTYADGTTFDFSVCTTPFLYSSPIVDQTILTPFMGDTDYLFLNIPKPVILVANAELDCGWVYQNASATATSSLGPHQSTLTVDIIDPAGNSTFSLTVTQTPVSGGGTYGVGNGGAVAVVDDPGHNPLVKQIQGSLRSDDSAGIGDCLLHIVVTGDQGASASIDFTITVRRLGDITGDGHVTAADRVAWNKNLNAVPSGLDANGAAYTRRHFDLDHDGKISAADRVLLSQVMNGISLP